jgi:DNA-binding transcriptional MerR regulator
LKQTSLFDFEQPAEENKLQQKDLLPVIEREMNIVNEDVVELDFVAVINKDNPTIEIKKSTRGRKKLSELALQTGFIEVPEDEILFQKKYYSIGIVAEMFKVNISLLRFWENEFDILKPKKNGKGDRHFRPEDVKNLKLIHHLLREKKYTIEGAKDFLKKNRKADENFSVIEELKKMQLFLTDLKMSL